MSGCYPLGFFKESSRETPLFVPKNDKKAKSCAFLSFVGNRFTGGFSKSPRNDISALHGMKQAIASCNDISTSYKGQPNKKQNDDVVKYKEINKRKYKGNEENVSGN